MKILFYNHTGQVSGAERLLLTILSRIDRDDFEPLLVCPEEQSLQQRATELGITVASVMPLEARFTWRLDRLARYCRSFLAVIRQLRRQVRSSKPDLLHANSIRAGLVATVATLGLGTRIVWHLHDMLPRHPLSTAIRLFAVLSRRTHLIAVSQAVAVNFRGRLTRLMKNRVHVILNAIDLKSFPPDQTAKRRIRRECRFRKTDLVVGIVGQLTPRKGQLELLHAFAEAAAEFPGMVLLIVGAPLFNDDHEYLKLIKRTAAQLGISPKLRILGPRNDVDTIMQALDILVVNSRVEPFGLVLLEAMACNTPVLATAVDGIPEIVKHNENGVLVPAQDEPALVDSLLSLCRQPEMRARLAAQGKQDVAALFSADRYLDQLQKFYYSRTKLTTAKSLEPTTTPAEAAKCA